VTFFPHAPLPPAPRATGASFSITADRPILLHHLLLCRRRRPSGKARAVPTATDSPSPAHLERRSGAPCPGGGALMGTMELGRQGSVCGRGWRRSTHNSDALPRDCGDDSGGEFAMTLAQILGDGAQASGARWWWGSGRHSPVPGRRLGRSSAMVGLIWS
jgi:hypothetical protein